MSSTEPIRLLTSKTWVLPPRTKPGRKPSLDTPTTKRKAQNRAAQRAFRERKASKIHELEESLQLIKSERNKIEIKYTNLVNDYSILTKRYNLLLSKSNNADVVSASFDINRSASSLSSGSGSETGAAGNNNKTCEKCELNESLIESLKSQVEQYQIEHSQISKDFSKAMPLAITTVNSKFGVATAMSTTSNNPNTDLITDNESLPTPSSQHASPEYVDDSCGVCLKDECLCESIGIKQPTRNADLIMKQQLQLESLSASPSAYCVPNSPYTEDSQLNSPADVPSESIPSPNNISSKFTNIIPNMKKSYEAKQFASNKPSLVKKRNNSKKFVSSPISREIDFTNKFKSAKNGISKKQARLSIFLKGSKDSNIKKSLNQKLEKIAISTVARGDIKHNKKKEKCNDALNTDLFDSLGNEVMTINPSIDNSFDPCGFCSADSPCICREASRELKLSTSGSLCNNATASNGTSKAIIELSSTAVPLGVETSKKQDTKLKPLIPGAYAIPDLFSPLSAVSSVSLFSSSTNISATRGRKDAENDDGCTGHPGTCRQCQSDPMSTLFCTTVASKVSHERAAPPPSPPVTQGSSLPPVLRARRNSLLTNISRLPVLPQIGASAVPRGGSLRKQDKLFIPCKDAYKTLLRHENFKYMDFGALVEMLEVDADMMVDVLSVAKVLRSMDKRV